MGDHNQSSHKPADRTAVKIVPERGFYDAATIHAIIDEALICHVGFLDGDHPFVIPTIHVRIGNQLYVHGSRASRMLKCLAQGNKACITITMLDGLVLARSAFHHSMNYRSVVVLGVGQPVNDKNKKCNVLHALTEHVIPGRWDDVRQPADKELATTMIVEFPLSEASAKIRTGPPIDDQQDYTRSTWAGVIPLSLKADKPITDPLLDPPIDTPHYATSYKRP